MAKNKTPKAPKAKLKRTPEMQQRINDAEKRVDDLLDYLPPNHPRVLDAKQYVKELEAI